MVMLHAVEICSALSTVTKAYRHCVLILVMVQVYVMIFQSNSNPCNAGSTAAAAQPELREACMMYKAPVC